MAKGKGRAKNAVQKKDSVVFCVPSNIGFYLVSQCIE